MISISPRHDHGISLRGISTLKLLENKKFEIFEKELEEEINPKRLEYSFPGTGSNLEPLNSLNLNVS